MLTIYFVNESTALDDRAAWQIAWACDRQLHYQLARSGWRSDMRAGFVSGGASAVIPAATAANRSAVMHLLDTSDQPGALGYHDEDGNEVPYGRVFAKTVQQYGVDVCETASHECLELAQDEHVNLTAPNGNLTRLYAAELGDPVQGNGYDVGAPEHRKLGFTVADFVLPNYFDPRTPVNQPTSFRGSVRGPFALAPKGYQSFIDLTNVKAGWQQKVGSERVTPVVDLDDRVARRVAKAAPVT